MIASAELGKRIAELLDTESAVTGVTAGKIRPEIQCVAPVSCVGGGELNPAKGHLELTAGWGHADSRGAVMPGHGKSIERKYSDEEAAAIESGADAAGITAATAFKLLEKTTFDIFLNDTAYWKNVPANVWNYYIGGYQVIKKWLSYRELGLLGRPLSKDEAREVMNMARRIAALILMQPALDENYARIKKSVYPWPKS